MKSCFLRSDVPRREEWQIQVPVGSSPWDEEGKGSDGEVGGVHFPPGKYIFSIPPHLAPVNLLLCRSSSAEKMQRTDSFRNPIWEPLLPLHPRSPGSPRATVWACISPAKAPLAAMGASPDAFGNREIPPPQSKTRNASGGMQGIPAEISFYISITPLCLNTLSPEGELPHWSNAENG